MLIIVRFISRREAVLVMMKSCVCRFLGSFFILQSKLWFWWYFCNFHPFFVFSSSGSFFTFLWICLLGQYLWPRLLCHSLTYFCCLLYSLTFFFPSSCCRCVRSVGILGPLCSVMLFLLFNERGCRQLRNCAVVVQLFILFNEAASVVFFLFSRALLNVTCSMSTVVSKFQYKLFSSSVCWAHCELVLLLCGVYILLQPCFQSLTVCPMYSMGPSWQLKG